MSNYDYSKPLTSQEIRNVESNRILVQAELKGLGKDTSIVNNMPMPTTPMTYQEVRNTVSNFERLERERKSMNLFRESNNTKYNNNFNSISGNSAYWSTADNIVCLVGLLLMVGAFLYFTGLWRVFFGIIKIFI